MHCDIHLSFEECELTILRKSVEEALIRRENEKTVSELEKKITKIVEKFLRDTHNLCYGHIAVNNILPKHAQFYDYTKMMPHYDCYSTTPIEHAKELANIFMKEGFTNVVAKSRGYYGTFKVIVDRVHALNITSMNPELFNAIKKEQIILDDICYVSPDLLRQSMYLDLSIPDEDITLWEKIYSRLLLLNEHYPIVSEACKKVISSSPTHNELYYLVRDTLVELDVVFMGGYADLLYIQYMDKQTDRYVNALSDFDVLYENPEDACNHLKEVLLEHKYKNIKIIKHPHFEELVGKHYEVKVNNKTVAMIYEPISCHSYNTIMINKQKFQVATIDTLLSYYLAFIYVDRPYYDRQKILCMCQLLIEIQKVYRLADRGLVKRFSTVCYGTQRTSDYIRDKRAEVFDKLKYRKGSYNYNMWFLNYNPANPDDNLRTYKPNNKLEDKEPTKEKRKYTRKVKK